MLNFAFNTRQKSIKQSQALNTTGTRGGQNTEVQFKTECPPEKKNKKKTKVTFQITKSAI